MCVYSYFLFCPVHCKVVYGAPKEIKTQAIRKPGWNFPGA